MSAAILEVDPPAHCRAATPDTEWSKDQRSLPNPAQITNSWAKQMMFVV